MSSELGWHEEPALAMGKAKARGGEPQPEPGLGHLHVESQAVRTRTKTPPQCEDPWSNTRVGELWEGEQSQG